MYNNFELTPNQIGSYDISPLSEEFTRVTVKSDSGEFNALKDVGAFVYNGDNLPPPPPYDGGAFPFAIVYYGAWNAGVAAFYAYSNTAFVVGGDGFLTGASGAEVHIRVFDADACEDAYTFSWRVTSGTVRVSKKNLLWTNTTIKDSTGADFLHWSRAEEATYKRYWYNNALAPELPERNEERYPYITMLASKDGLIYELDATNVPGVIVQDAASPEWIELQFNGTNILHSGWVASPNQITAANWEDLSIGNLSSSQKWTVYAEGISREDGWHIGGDSLVIFWANYDLKTEDGTVVLKASEPMLEWLDLPYGRTLTVEVPWGTQRNADILLATVSDYRYQPFTADKVFLDPAAELGDGITVNGTTSVLCSQDISFGVLTAANISAPEDEELDHEYTYKTKQERTAARQSAAIRKTEGVTSGRETAERLKTQEFYVGGQKYAPMTITYTDGNGNPGTMTVLGLVP